MLYTLHTWCHGQCILQDLFPVKEILNIGYFRFLILLSVSLRHTCTLLNNPSRFQPLSPVSPNTL